MKSIAASLLLLISSPAFAADMPPEGVVRAAVQAASSINPDDQAIISKFFSKGFADDLRKVSSLKECNYWDANIISGGQEQDKLVILKATTASDTGKTAIVNTTIQAGYEGEMRQPSPIIFILVNENGWRIDEIVTQNYGLKIPFAGTHHAYVRALFAHNCEQ